MSGLLPKSVRAFAARPWREVADAVNAAEDAFRVHATPAQLLARLEALAHFARERGACDAANREADLAHHCDLSNLFDAIDRRTRDPLR